jgi:hypothetical protein
MALVILLFLPLCKCNICFLSFPNNLHVLKDSQYFKDVIITICSFIRKRYSWLSLVNVQINMVCQYFYICFRLLSYSSFGIVNFVCLKYMCCIHNAILQTLKNQSKKVNEINWLFLLAQQGFRTLKPYCNLMNITCRTV